MAESKTAFIEELCLMYFLSDSQVVSNASQNNTWHFWMLQAGKSSMSGKRNFQRGVEEGQPSQLVDTKHSTIYGFFFPG